MLRTAGHNQHNLCDQIAAALPGLPSYLQDLDHVRELGNLAAHEATEKNSGAIIDIDEEDAVWLLDLVDLVFDHYYVKPAQAAAMNQKIGNRKALRRGAL